MMKASIMTLSEAQIKYDEACHKWHTAVDFMHTSGNWMIGCVAESLAAKEMSDAAAALDYMKIIKEEKQ